jgi:hypothetical protein
MANIRLYFVLFLAISLVLDVQARIDKKKAVKRGLIHLDHYEPHPEYGKYEEAFSFRKPWLSGLFVQFIPAKYE